MEFSTTDILDFPIDLVFATHRDHLSEVADYLPNVASIEVQSREDSDGFVRFVNIWTAERTEVPRVLRVFVKPQMLRWIDRATWLEADRVCNWDLELGFLKEAIRMQGVNRMTTLSEGRTQVEIAGQIDVDAGKIPGVPSFMSGRVGKAVEGFVVKMITPNLKKTNEGVAAYLTANQAQ